MCQDFVKDGLGGNQGRSVTNRNESHDCIGDDMSKGIENKVWGTDLTQLETFAFLAISSVNLWMQALTPSE